jgi:succinyl-diaminopimelate desuccinylase
MMDDSRYDTTDPVQNLTALIQCESVTPADGGALQVLTAMLEPLGFTVERPTFTEAGTADIVNLYARSGTSGRHLMFAGHTDVVPTGNAARWRHPPFSATIDEGQLYGRGAVDMKGGIACFVAAVARQMKTAPLPGSISLLITGDEEGPAINGTVKLLDWARQRGETWDASIVGEPTNPDLLGDMIKIGRRGSLSATVTVHGVQGHAAYPHLADNPLPGLLTLADALITPALDTGTDNFQPSNLEITSIDTGNPAVNVIPTEARFSFNVRFNDTWSAETLMTHLQSRLNAAARSNRLRSADRDALRFTIEWRDRPSHVFLTRDDKLTDTLVAAIHAVTGRTPALSTKGGTSDARFIKDYCPVVEFGLVGQTMHMIDERVPLADLEQLTQIYERFLAGWFA